MTFTDPPFSFHHTILYITVALDKNVFHCYYVINFCRKQLNLIVHKNKNKLPEKQKDISGVDDVFISVLTYPVAIAILLAAV